MAASLTPLKEFKCTYKDCAHSYDSEKLMKKHKYESENHTFFCKRCNYDGIDWEDSTAHKVEAMAYWLYGPGSDPNVKPKLYKHIVCEFCGKDFESLGGRDIHRKREHQADQQIRCQGSAEVWDAIKSEFKTETCNEVFGRASQYVRHIEQGRCPFIKKHHIEAERQQKYLIGELLKNPNKFARRLDESQDLSGCGKKTDSLGIQNDEDEIEDESEAGGGVQIMDGDDASQAASFHPLEPHRKAESPMEQVMVDKHEAFPRLSVEQCTTPCSTSSETSSNPAAISAWSGGNTTKSLFPGAKTTPPVERDWQAIEASKDRSRHEDNKSNLFHMRPFDPFDKDYDPELFRTSFDGRYQCPYSNCYTNFDIAVDITSHIQTKHIFGKRTCKACRRSFKDLTSLIQHYEASSRGGKCRVARLYDYDKILEEITGGFLSATSIDDPKIWGLDENEVQEGPVGVRSHEYKAHMPTRGTDARRSF